MWRSLFSVIVVMSFVACGDKDKGVTARLHQKTIITPQMVEKQAQRYVTDNATKTPGDEHSLSSQAIRNDTLGLRVKATPAAGDAISVRVEHYQTFSQDKCRNTYQDIVINADKRNAKWIITQTLNLMCLEYSCHNMIVVIKESSSSYLSNSGQIVRAFVPILLHLSDITDSNGGRYYLPGSASSEVFLRLKNDINTVCLKSDEVVYNRTQIAVSPNDDTGPDYNYFPHDDNNTWIYW